MRGRAGILALGAILAPWWSQAQVIGAGYSAPAPIDVSPGQVITIFARIPGKTPADPVSAAPPLPNVLGGFSVLLRQTFSDPLNAPILSVADAQSCSNLVPSQCNLVSMITLQIPFELVPNVPRTTGPENFARLEISYNNTLADSLFLNPLPDRIHVLNSCDVAANLPPGTCLPLVTHSDGSLVSRDNPAQTGEALTMALVGLGWAVDSVTTGAATPSPGPLVNGVLIIFDTGTNASPEKPGAGSAAANAQMLAGSVGFYEATFTVPSLDSGTPNCSSTIRSNLTVSLGRATSFDGAGICVNMTAQ
jgi:uncharacterized protein (TIGR03437 family)